MFVAQLPGSDEPHGHEQAGTYPVKDLQATAVAAVVCAQQATPESCKHRAPFINVN